MFSVELNVSGLIHKMDTLANSAADLEKPIAVFLGYLRKKALAKYEAQGFAPLAQSTVEKRAQRGRQSLERTLYRDFRKAVKRGAGGREGIVGEVIGQATRGSRNRLAVLAEFQRRHGLRSNSLSERADLVPLSVKQAASLDSRTQRAVDRAVGKPVLGGLPRTLVVLAGPSQGTLRSATYEKWSAAHNEGATVGHGAVLPERKTLEIESGDLGVFESILKDHLLLPITEGMHGPAY